MNYGEIVKELRDLGFEEDSTMDEYSEITVHAVNRSVRLIYDTVVIPLKGWFRKELSTPLSPWEPEEPTEVPFPVDRDAHIDLPNHLLKPCALLAAYYLWLDDDVEKAVMYFNNYEQFVAEFKAACEKDARGTVISAGWGW